MNIVLIGLCLSFLTCISTPNQNIEAEEKLVQTKKKNKKEVKRKKRTKSKKVKRKSFHKKDRRTKKIKKSKKRTRPLKDQLKKVQPQIQDPLISLKQLAKKYAPLVILHESERYFPSSIDFYLQNCALKDSSNDTTVIEQGTLTYDHLKRYKERKYFLSPTGDTLTIYGGTKPRFDENLNKLFIESPCYTNIFQRNNGEVIFQYWFFYPFNGSIPEIVLAQTLKGDSSLKKIKSLGDHEGDWEHIDVCLNPPNGLEQERTIKWAYYARHVSRIPNPQSRLSKIRAKKHIKDLPVIGTDQAYYSADELDFYNGTHPIVLSALFGHASYPKIPRSPIKLIPDNVEEKLQILTNKGFDRVSDKGAHWQTWENLAFVASNGVPFEQAQWLHFFGDWGLKGPDGPAAKDSWRNSEYSRSLRKTIDVPLSHTHERQSESFEIDLLKHAQDKLYLKVDHPLAEHLEITLFEGKKIFAQDMSGQGQIVAFPQTLDDLRIMVKIKQGFEDEFNGIDNVNVQVFSQENR